MGMQAFLKDGKQDFTDIIHANRVNYMTRFIDLEGWKKISDKVEKFAPDIVILQSRRMPRLHKILRSQNILDLNARFISEFAIPFISKDLENSRVAIVDDTVNGGRTLKGTFDLIGKYSRNVHAFALLKRDGGGTAMHADDLTCIYEGVSEDNYRKASARTALALWLANEPFECEFPVFRLSQRPESLSWPEFLTHEFGDNAVHRLDTPESPFIGYARYSVDLAPESVRNDKLRIYEDLVSGETVMVCMADMKGSVQARYIYAREMGEKLTQGKLKSAGEWHIEKPDISLLFGTEEMPSLKTEKLRGKSHDFMQIHWPNIKKKVKPSWSLYDCFYNFFIGLRNYMAPLQERSSVRLHIGPTFAQLLVIMQELWRPEGNRENLHFLLSQLLDEQIDLGFVVPERDDDGNRIFRKGEPAGNNSDIAQLLESMGIPVKPEEDLHAILKGLTESQSQRLEYLRRLSELQ